MLEQGFADNGLFLYRGGNKNRQPSVGFLLIFTCTANMNIIVPTAPVFGDTFLKAVDALCYDKKCHIWALLYHLPALTAPFVGVLDKKIRGKAGVYYAALRRHFVGAVLIALCGQVKGLILYYPAAVLVKLRVAPVYIAVKAARAEFFTAVPRIPSVIHITKYGNAVLYPHNARLSSKILSV